MIFEHDDVFDNGVNIKVIGVGGGGNNAVNRMIEANIKGKVCIDLDIDRQRITPFGTPQQVRDLVKEEISRLGTRDGGLMLTYGWYPGVPLENIKALMDTLEENMYYV